jgi:hypothetical protein
MNSIAENSIPDDGMLYEILTHEGELIYDEYRKSGNFYSQYVVEITKAICDEFDLSEDYIGFWQSQVYVRNPTDSSNDDEMFPFDRVIKKQKEVITIETSYKKVEP